LSIHFYDGERFLKSCLVSCREKKQVKLVEDIIGSIESSLLPEYLRKIGFSDREVENQLHEPRATSSISRNFSLAFDLCKRLGKKVVTATF